MRVLSPGQLWLLSETLQATVRLGAAPNGHPPGAGNGGPAHHWHHIWRTGAYYCGLENECQIFSELSIDPKCRGNVENASESVIFNRKMVFILQSAAQPTSFRLALQSRHIVQTTTAPDSVLVPYNGRRETRSDLFGDVDSRSGLSNVTQEVYLVRFDRTIFTGGGVQYQQMVADVGGSPAGWIDFVSCVQEVSATPLLDLQSAKFKGYFPGLEQITIRDYMAADELKPHFGAALPAVVAINCSASQVLCV